jgi:hypothetical protein
MAFLAVTGDARRVWLESRDGRFPAGRVPAGTYKMTAFFDGVDPVTVGDVALASGQTKTMRCSAQLMSCR